MALLCASCALARAGGDAGWRGCQSGAGKATSSSQRGSQNEGCGPAGCATALPPCGINLPGQRPSGLRRHRAAPLLLPSPCNMGDSYASLRHHSSSSSGLEESRQGVWEPVNARGSSGDCTCAIPAAAGTAAAVVGLPNPPRRPATLPRLANPLDQPFGASGAVVAPPGRGGGGAARVPNPQSPLTLPVPDRPAHG